MQQRSEPNNSLDDFPTPPWATRALCEWMRGEGVRNLRDLTCREPAANRGHMVRPLAEYFGTVEGSDVHDYGAGYPIFDFVGMEIPPMVDWTITNPPFRLAESFIHRALETSHMGVAVIVRSAFLEGVGRYYGLFDITPPSDILQFSERVVMHRGKLTATGSSATAYSWLIWDKYVAFGAPRFHWIPPCRKQLERVDDYPELNQPADPALEVML